jgi:hypothetical protein
MLGTVLGTSVLVQVHSQKTAERIYLGKWPLLNYREPALDAQGFNSPRLQASLATKFAREACRGVVEGEAGHDLVYNAHVASYAPAS